jgi:RimJ/RimL family protein N-acetyltransferase
MHQIVRQSDACVIGDVSYGALTGEEDTLAIQYEVAPSAQCQGFASEAIIALVDWLLSQPSVRCVRAEILKGNAPSEKVARKAGLEYVRTVGDNGVFECCRQPNAACREANLENRR